MKTIKTDIIPASQEFIDINAPHKLDLKAICCFAATGFFLDTDTYWQHKKALAPASTHTFDETGKLIQSEPWFQWHYSPRDISFEQALQEFTELFETIIAAQTVNKKVILHLCADLGSDSRFYQLDDDYEVIMVGEKIGVENYTPPKNVYGVIANPVCTEFSTANGFHKVNDLKKGMEMVNHCIRIIEECNPVFWVCFIYLYLQCLFVSRHRQNIRFSIEISVPFRNCFLIGSFHGI